MGRTKGMGSTRWSGVCVQAVALFIAFTAHGQTYGPLNPVTTGNDAGVGTLAWGSTANAKVSDNAYATMGTKGISNYLTATNFGFTIPAPSGIAGIQLDVERSTVGSQNVSLLDAWTVGLTKTVSAGPSRCLVVAYAQENGNSSRDLTALTYGGRQMTQLSEQTCGNTGNFMGRIELWVLLDADIALAASTALVPTFGAFTSVEYCDVFTAAVYQNVDQLLPYANVVGTGAVSPPNTSNPHQLGAPVATPAGSMALNLVTCGNNTSPASTDGGTNTYTINSGYTEGVDRYFANTTDAPNSGASMQVAYKPIAAAGSEQPSCTFSGSVNRWAMIGLVLLKARELDHRVQLIKGGVIGGSDLSSSAAWPTSDAYITYGGPTSLWGRTWTIADINASNFGAALAVRVQNGIASVDHMRVTVYAYSTLPVELLDLTARPEGSSIRVEWVTASEANSSHFVVQRSRDAITFTDVGIVPAAGNTSMTTVYAELDKEPLPGTSYYRLKQVDLDGSSELSPTVSVEMAATGISLYPNPTDDQLNIYTTTLSVDEVAVYTTGMRLVRKMVIAPDADPIISIGDLDEGIYLLQVRTSQGIQTFKVIKASRRM